MGNISSTAGAYLAVSIIVWKSIPVYNLVRELLDVSDSLHMQDAWIVGRYEYESTERIP